MMSAASLIFCSSPYPGADLQELHGEHGHEWNRPLYAYTDEERRRGRDNTHGQPRCRSLPVDQTQQPILYPLWLDINVLNNVLWCVCWALTVLNWAGRSMWIHHFTCIEVWIYSTRYVCGPELDGPLAVSSSIGSPVLLHFHHAAFRRQLKNSQNRLWCVIRRTSSSPDARLASQTPSHITNSAWYCSCE